MNRSEIEKILQASLEHDADLVKIRQAMEPVISNYDFKSGFRERILQSLFSPVLNVKRYEFFKSMSWAFSRVALISVAAIFLLLISIFIMEDSFSLNAVLGLSEDYDNVIISMLTGY